MSQPAMSDPVTSKSTFLCMYMSNHPDTLVAYVKHFGKVPGNVRSAEMKSIDSKGMNLSYTLKGGDVGSIHVKFSPPLSGYDEVKPRLLAMKADAQEALGMLRSPKITSFRFPLNTILPLLGLVYLGLAPPQGTSFPFIPTSITDIVFMPPRMAFGMFGLQPSMKTIVQITGAAHSLETLYTWYLCRQFVKGPLITAAYLSATLFFGFPIWVDLRKRVQEKRIESVMKVE